MEEIIRQLEHTIEYFKDAQTDFQRGRVFEAEKILQALRIHDVVGLSEQLFCGSCNREIDAMDKQVGLCYECGYELATAK